MSEATTSSLCGVSTYLCLGVLALAGYHFLYKRRTSSPWKGCGVKVPNVTWKYFLNPDFRKTFSTLLTEHGDTIGVTTPKGPMLVTMNLDLMRTVLIKDFNNFSYRSESLTTRSPFGSSLFFAGGDAWRRRRQIMSPAFTSGKLKHISNKVIDSSESLVNFLEDCARTNRLVPVKDATGAFSSELIAKTAFGMDANFIGHEQSQFTKYSKTLLQIHLGWKRTFVGLVRMIPYMAVFLAKVLGIQMFDVINADASQYFTSILSHTIKEHRQQKGGGASNRDFLDLVLEANEAASAGSLQQDKEDQDVSSSAGFTKGPLKSLSDEEVYGESILVIFAGFETTSTTLQWALLEMARNPDVQEKAYQEVKRIVKGKRPTIDELKELEYLDQVINETLRLYPPAPLIDRKARETRTYSGVTIPAGATVMFPFWMILKDPKYWATPNSFNPEHFSKEAKENRDPMAFTPFGQGPRLCLGMRLAYLELRMALACVLPKVKIVLNDCTEPQLGEEVVMSPLPTPSPVKPLKLAFELRSN